MRLKQISKQMLRIAFPYTFSITFGALEPGRMYSGGKVKIL